MTTKFFDYVVITPEGTPLGGDVHLEVQNNGDFYIRFHMHCSSIFADFSFNLRAYVTVPNGATFLFQHTGNVNGKQSHDYEERGNNPQLRNHFASIATTGVYMVSKDYEWGGAVGTLVTLVHDVIEFVAGAAGTALGIIIGVTREAIGWLNLNLGPGGTIGVVAGVVIFAVAAPLLGGGAALITATVAGIATGAVINSQIERRYLNALEIECARQVFGNTLAYDKVILTNLGGMDGRAFTAPGADGKTYVNLGKNFSNPLVDWPRRGQLLIHELTHAWQIEHTTFLPGLMCSGIVNQTQYGLFGDNKYEFGPAGPPWDGFNLEQQASIIDQWFAGNGHSSAYSEMDQENPYFRYIGEDILHHVPGQILFALGQDNVVRTAHRDGSGWHWSAIGDATFNQGSPITAVCSGDALDIFVLGQDNVVRTAFRDGSGWHWSTIPGAAFNQRSPITAVRHGNALDIFVLGNDNVVRTAFRDGSGWHWSAIGGAAFNQGNPITAVRSGDTLDIFVLGQDNVVRTASRDRSGWHWSMINGAAFNQGNPITAVRSGKALLDIFVLGQDNVVRTAFRDGSGWHWSAVNGATFKQGSPITAVRRGNALDIFVLGQDNVVRTAFRDGSGWHWSAINGAAFPQVNRITAVRRRDALDIFVLGGDNVVRTAFRDESGWHWSTITGAAFNQGNQITVVRT
jgi:hypothetical protein